MLILKVAAGVFIAQALRPIALVLIVWIGRYSKIREWDKLNRECPLNPSGRPYSPSGFWSTVRGCY